MVNIDENPFRSKCLVVLMSLRNEFCVGIDIDQNIEKIVI